MAGSKNKFQNILETMNEEDKIRLIKFCYSDKLVYGYVKWKNFDRKAFNKQLPVNDFKNTWRQLNKNIDNWKLQYQELLEEIENYAKEICARKKGKRIKILNSKVKKQPTIITSPRSILFNSSLVRNFSRYNSAFFKCNSNCRSPLNESTSGISLNTSFFMMNKNLITQKTSKNDIHMKTQSSNINNNIINSISKRSKNLVSKHVSFTNLKSNIITNINKSKSKAGNIDYIKRNVSDIKKKSEFLDFYFLIILLIYENKSSALLKKIEQFHEMKLLRSCNTQNAIQNNHILNIVKKIYEISSTTGINTNMKSFSSRIGTNSNWDKLYMSKCTTIEKWHSNKWANLTNEYKSKYDELDKRSESKNIFFKNVMTIEIKDKVVQFNKNLMNYKWFYNILKKNVDLKNNKVLFFLIPLPNKPTNVLFKKNKFYHLNKLVILDKNTDEDIYNYVYIMQKFYLSFAFWTSCIKTKGIEQMKILFNKELEELDHFINEDCSSKKDEKMIHQKGVSKTENEMKKINIKYMLLISDFDVENIISLCFYAFKKYKNAKKRIDMNFFRIIKILNLCLTPKTQKVVLRHYIKITFTLYYTIKKIELVQNKKHKKKNRRNEKNNYKL